MIAPMSDIVLDRAIIVEIIWLPEDDPRRQVTLSEGEEGRLLPNLPECRRVKSLTTNWLEIIMGHTWKTWHTWSERTRGLSSGMEKDLHLLEKHQ